MKATVNNPIYNGDKLRITYLILEDGRLNHVRDLIYVNYDVHQKRVISSGIEFKEFIQSLSSRPNNILVLEGCFSSTFDFNTNCAYCRSEDMNDFLKEDVYSYGNFSWVDFESVDGLKSLVPQEVAELFYIGKMWKAVNNTWFEKLNNRFIYTAHDDGWINHIVYNNKADYHEVLGNVILNKVFDIYNIKPNIMDDDIINKLCQLSMEGLAVDLLGLSIEEDNAFVIPIYKLGKLDDMDEVFRLARESGIQVDFELRYSKHWDLIEL